MIRAAAPLLAVCMLIAACATQSPPPPQPETKRSERNFIVMIEGRNLLFDDRGQPTRFGFSTTREIVAKTARDAEAAAIRSVHEDETLRERLINPPNDPPRVTATHSIEVESFDAVLPSDPGYIFYLDRDSK